MVFSPIRFQPSGRRVALRPGASLLEAVAQARLPLARACAGDGLCGRCGVRILGGAGSLPPESAAEARAKRRNRVDPALRLACRVVPAGPLEVTAPGWGGGEERRSRDGASDGRIPAQLAPVATVTPGKEERC